MPYHSAKQYNHTADRVQEAWDFHNDFDQDRAEFIAKGLLAKSHHLHRLHRARLHAIMAYGQYQVIMHAENALNLYKELYAQIEPDIKEPGYEVENTLRREQREVLEKLMGKAEALLDEACAIAFHHAPFTHSEVDKIREKEMPQNTVDEPTEIEGDANNKIQSSSQDDTDQDEHGYLDATDFVDDEDI